MAFCKRNAPIEECEIPRIESQIEKIETIVGKEEVSNPKIQEMLKILEDFIKEKKRILYGGTAINNHLPKKAKFYNYETELPDYDFYSPQPLRDAKELANLYHRKGYKNILAKAGVHVGTFKVSVEYIQLADITYMERDLYDILHKYSKKIDGLYNAPVNFLRVGLYLELSRPRGDVSRWTKVFKRLELLNKYEELVPSKLECSLKKIQRPFDAEDRLSKKEEYIVYNIIRDTTIEKEAVFFGSSAFNLFLNKAYKKKILHTPDFDILTTQPKPLTDLIVERLRQQGIKGVRVLERPNIGENIGKHYEIRIGKETVAFVYATSSGCENYNIIHYKGDLIRVATMDTILKYYLAFLYSGRPYYDTDRLLCMADMIYNIQKQFRGNQKGVLQRFTLPCIGEQETLRDIMMEKGEAFMKLNKDSLAYKYRFFKYDPDFENRKMEVKKTKSKSKTKKNRSKSKKSKKGKSKTKKTKSKSKKGKSKSKKGKSKSKSK